MATLEDLQRKVWAGSDLEIVPGHMLIAAVDHGGLAIGAYSARSEAEQPELIGFVFGFPCLYPTPDGPRPMHCSHMLGVHPDFRNQGIGFLLKRAQWQMVRHQTIDRIVWTYDPLLSRNAQLNIGKLGAVCNTYKRNYYGEMRDALNTGLPSDRFQVDWWVNSQRVNRRLSKRARLPLDLAHYLAAGAEVINPTQIGADGWPQPAQELHLQAGPSQGGAGSGGEALLLVEIPADFLALKAADRELALRWRTHTRSLFEDLFRRGYLVTDFIFLPGTHPRSFYVLSYGESTL
jgi:predicted GNAT superfamily acetyltransferase